MSTTEQALPDIREGDLVKATRGERVVVGRAHEYRSGQGYLDIEDFSTLDPLSEWDIEVLEVLDRPLPPIDEELLEGATDAYRAASYYDGETTAHHVKIFSPAINAVINYLREHDTYNKESK